MSHDYLREIDLNPALGPVVDPLDPRAMHYFGFLSEGQEITMVQPFGGTPRILISFHYGNQPTTPGTQPQPPIDAILDFSGGPPIVRYEENHERAHVLIWLDPASPLPPTGQAKVRVRAWATK